MTKCRVGLFGGMPAKAFRQAEAIQNDIEELSHTDPRLRGRNAAEFVDISLLTNLESESFFNRLHES